MLFRSPWYVNRHGRTRMAMALWPDTPLAEWPLRFPLLFPIAVLLAFFSLRFFGGGREFRADAAEVKVILNDDFRRANLLRAQRIALVLILIAQVPLGVLFMTTRSAIALALSIVRSSWLRLALP